MARSSADAGADVALQIKVKKEFQDLGDKFKWEQALVDWMTAADGLGALTLMDFVYALPNEEAAEAIVEAAGFDQKPKIMQQASRVRQAWLGMKKTIKDAETLKTRGLDDNDLDTILPQEQLDDLADKFFARYRMYFPSFVMPSDLVISRIYKEITKKLLTFRDVWKIKSQGQLLKATRKKTIIADGLEMVQGDVEGESEIKTIREYLSKLFTLMLAYAVAGATAVEGCPLVEKRGADSTMYVQVPLDIVLRYYYRVKRYADELPAAVALGMVQKRDECERELWIDGFRNGGKTLGEVIVKTAEIRESVWHVPDEIKKMRGREGQEEPERRSKRDAEGKPKGGGTKMTSADIECKFRNGTKLCREYQFGNCKAADCAKGKHKCARKTGANARVCGGMHAAINCLAKNRQTSGN